MAEKNMFDENPVLRQHQADALVKIQEIIDSGEGKGRIVLPTGTGKTRIEVEAVCNIIKKNIKDGKWGGIHVILSPRILLAYQQLDEFIKIMTKNGIDCRWMVVNSGGLNSEQYKDQLEALGVEDSEDIGCTTKTETIQGEMEIEKDKRPFVIFSTYHSVDRVNTAAENLAIKIQSYIFDEAQYCVTSGSFKDALDFESSFKFFFTATEKWTDNEEEGYGMNNESRFGKLVFTEKPRTLIERGEMASVAIHEIRMVEEEKSIKKHEWDSMAKAIVLAFDTHRVVVKRFSSCPTTIGPKMIVVCDCQSSLEGIMNSKVMKEYKTSHQTVNLCGLSSNFGIEINGNKKPKANNREKQSLLKEMRGWKSADEAIILHVDMIGEGIDVAGITAIMPFRNFGKIKFLQNIGRGTRLVKNDRERLYREEILPADLKSADKGGKYIKPYCWLVLPVLSSEYKDTKERYAKYILTLRKDYGFDTSEMVVLTTGQGPWEPREGPRKDKGEISDIVNIIEELDIIEEEIKIDEATHTLNTLTEEGLSELIMGLGK